MGNKDRNKEEIILLNGGRCDSQEMQVPDQSSDSLGESFEKINSLDQLNRYKDVYRNDYDRYLELYKEMRIISEQCTNLTTERLLDAQGKEMKEIYNSLSDKTMLSIKKEFEGLHTKLALIKYL